MNPTLTPEQLRAIFLAASDPAAARALALASSLSLAAAVLWLVRRRSLREEYTPIWMGVAAALLLVSLRLDWIHALTRATGAWTPRTSSCGPGWRAPPTAAPPGTTSRSPTWGGTTFPRSSGAASSGIT